MITKKCSKCGEINKISFFNKRKNSRDGYCGICKNCSRKYVRNEYNKNIDYHRKRRIEYRKNNLQLEKEREKKYNQTLDGKFNQYNKNARQRKLVFELKKEEFKKYWGGRCYYCNDKIETIGIDRIDSSIGYIKGNMVRCCRVCNLMKRNTSSDEFINKCKKIVMNTKRKYREKYEISCVLTPRK